MKKIKIRTIILFLFAAIIFYSGLVFYQLRFAPLITQPIPKTIIVHPGMSVTELASELHQQGMLSHPRIFELIADLNGQALRLHLGEYWIKPSMSALDLLHNIATGSGYVVRNITFIEGWTFRDVKKALVSDPNIKHTLVQNIDDKKIMEKLGHAGLKPEGLFFPDTYSFTWGNSDQKILKNSFQKMQKLINTEWKTRAPDLPYKDSYQALIMASLVERETALNQERSLIAGVLLNRLRINMRLQVDPTVLYGVGKTYDETITKTDLHSNSPYNTYASTGLPPTPICMPSAASIHAVLHPVKSDYLFYVSRGNGSHEFSKDYAQHLLAVAKYRPKKDVNVAKPT